MSNQLNDYSFAYLNYGNKRGDAKKLVAITDSLLNSEMY